MSFNLKRVTASLVATTMAVQTLATPVLAAGTQSTVAKTGAAAQSTAATVQTSTGKAPVTFTNSAHRKEDGYGLCRLQKYADGRNPGSTQ